MAIFQKDTSTIYRLLSIINAQFWCLYLHFKGHRTHFCHCRYCSGSHIAYKRVLHFHIQRSVVRIPTEMSFLAYVIRQFFNVTRVRCKIKHHKEHICDGSSGFIQEYGMNINFSALELAQMFICLVNSLILFESR